MAWTADEPPTQAERRGRRGILPRLSLWRDALRKLHDFVSILGPGLIAGASDNDPTTVATLAVIGPTNESIGVYVSRHCAILYTHRTALAASARRDHRTSRGRWHEGRLGCERPYA
jgi:hypothetical protein